MKRFFHSWDKWECYKSGFYSNLFKDKTPEEAKNLYSEFLGNLELFEKALKLVIKKWKYSCEHFLTNPSINKIAWLGQASACIWYGLPSKYKGGFCLLSKKKQEEANKLARRYLRIWEKEYKSIFVNGEIRGIQLEFQMKYH